ncbi:STAS domain-containing protein [Acuticoccus kandeliae]|uniref:STAS domain-containing protein n=1 Tax=Acuticoccus kandeliae TaxID=2073160 RepID=UPI000D3E872B|nr:STAS domain-containing protein [Acuticoccus kandeliae]
MDATSGTLSIESCDFETIGELHQALLEQLTTGRKVVVDVAELATAPLALVQLLHAAHRTAEARDATLAVTGVRMGALGPALDAFGLTAAHAGAPRIEDDSWTGVGSRKETR